MEINKPIIGLLVLLSCLLMMTSACGKKSIRGASGLEDLSSDKVDHKAQDNANSNDYSGDPLVQLEETVLGGAENQVSSDGVQSREVEALSASDLHDDKFGTMVVREDQEAGNGSLSIFTPASSSADRSGVENGKSPSAVSGRSSDASEPDGYKAWSTEKRGVHFSHGLQDVFFAYDSWRLSKKSHQILESNAEWLKAHPHERISIEGHCDERGTRAYNYVLGEKRAQMAKEYLSHLGVPLHQMVVVSFGKDRPICRVFAVACFQANRRAHFSRDKNTAARD